MSHEPPIPAGNQSPFPLHEKPHRADGPPPDAEVARTPDPAPAVPRGALIGGLIAAGVAALAAVGAWAYATEPKNKRKARKRRGKKQSAHT